MKTVNSAWEFYTELSTRVAVTGKPEDQDRIDFDGELYIESLESLYVFFHEARRIMRRFPVGRLSVTQRNHLGSIISRTIARVLRSFFEKWQVIYRHWREHQSNPRLAPLGRQVEFPQLKEFLTDWADVRWLMRELQNEIVKVYNLIDVKG